MDFSINKKVLEVLKSVLDSKGIKYKLGWYDANINDTHVTFIIPQEDEDEYADDENTSEVYLIQVDIWSKENMESLKRELKKAFKDAEFLYQDGANLYETDTKIYHYAMRFEYYNFLEG